MHNMGKQLTLGRVLGLKLTLPHVKKRYILDIVS